MIKGSGQEACGLVTVHAVIICWYVISWLTSGSYTVMTFRAIAGDSLVVECRTRKRRSVMTVSTILTIAKWNMRWIYLGISSCCIHTVMTRVTARTSRNIAVIEYCRYPCDTRCVAKLTVIAVGRTMRATGSICTRCGCRIVTSGLSAIIHNAGMIHKIVQEANTIGCNVCMRMTGAAICRCVRMAGSNRSLTERTHGCVISIVTGTAITTDSRMGKIALTRR